MDVNQLPITPHARQIVGRCLLGGVEVPFVSFEVDNNGFYQADTFRVSFATNGLPARYNLEWFASQAVIEVELHVGIISKLGVDWTQLIVGNADLVAYDPARFEVMLEGRDFTAYFIDNKVAPSWKNMTSSQVATQLAKKYGLSPVVTATKTRVGTYYQIDSVSMQSDRTEWDFLAYLAAWEGFQVYVKGRELHFEPALEPAKADQYLIRWAPPGNLAYPQANVSDDLRFDRNLTLAKGVTVQVLSHNVKTNKPFSVTYPEHSAKGTAPGQASPRRQVYTIRRAGLTHDGAMQLAQQVHRDITRHEMRLSGSTAGDNLLMPDTIIRVEGTGSQFDQLYYADSVRRAFSWDAGYHMSFSAKNHNPNSNPSV